MTLLRVHSTFGIDLGLALLALCPVLIPGWGLALLWHGQDEGLGTARTPAGGSCQPGLL